MKKYQSFLSENVQFLEVKFSIYLNMRVFVMLRYEGESISNQPNLFPVEICLFFFDVIAL